MHSPTAPSGSFWATRNTFEGRFGLFQDNLSNNINNDGGGGDVNHPSSENHELAPIYFIDPTLSDIMDSDIFQSLGSNPERPDHRQHHHGNSGGGGGALRALGFRKKGKGIAGGSGGSSIGGGGAGSQSMIRLTPNDPHPQKPSARNTPMLSFQLHHTEMSTERPSVSGRLLLHIPRLRGKKFHFVSLALHLRLKEAIAWTRQDLVTFESERQSWSQTVWDKKMMLQFQDKQVEEGPDSYMTCRIREEVSPFDGLVGAAAAAVGSRVVGGGGSGSGGTAGSSAAAAGTGTGTGTGTSGIAGVGGSGGVGQRSRDVTIDIAADEWRWEWLMPVTRHEVRPESFEGSMGTLWYELEAKCLFRWDEVDEQGRVKETLFPSTQAVEAILDTQRKDKHSSDKNSHGHVKTRSLAKVFSKLRVRTKPSNNNNNKYMVAGDFAIGHSPIASTSNIPSTEYATFDNQSRPHEKHRAYSITNVPVGGGSSSGNNKVKPERTGPPEPLPFLIRKLVKLYFVRPPPRPSANPSFFLPAPSMALPNLPGTRRLKAIIPGARIQVQIQIPTVIPIPGYDLTSNLVPSHKKGGSFLVPASDRHHLHHYHHHPVSGPAAAAAEAAAAAAKAAESGGATTTGGAAATATPGTTTATTTTTTSVPLSAKEKERQAQRERALAQFPNNFQVALTIRKVTQQDIQRNDILRRRYESTSTRPRSMVDVYGQSRPYYSEQQQQQQRKQSETTGAVDRTGREHKRINSHSSSFMETATIDTTASVPWATAESTQSGDPLLVKDGGNRSTLSCVTSPLPPSSATAPPTPRAWRKEIRVRRVKCEFWQKESCRIPTDNAPSRTVKVALGQPFVYSDKDGSKGKARQRQNSVAAVAQQLVTPFSQGGGDGARPHHDAATTPAEEEQLLPSSSSTSSPSSGMAHSQQYSLTGYPRSAHQNQAFMLLIPIPLDSPKLRQTFSWPTSELLAQVTQAMIASQHQQMLQLQQQYQQQQLQNPNSQEPFGFAGAGGTITLARPVAIDGHYFVNDRRYGQGYTSVGEDSSSGYGGTNSFPYGGTGSEMDQVSGLGVGGGDMIELGQMNSDMASGDSQNKDLMLSDWPALPPSAAAEVAAIAAGKMPHVKARMEVKHYLSFRLSIDMLEFEGEPEDEEQDLELAEEQQLQLVKERQEVSAAVLSPGSRNSFYEQIQQRHQAAAAAAAAAAVVAAAGTGGATEGAGVSASPMAAATTAATDAQDPLRAAPSRSSSIPVGQGDGGSSGGGSNISQRRGSKGSLGILDDIETHTGGKERLLKKPSLPLFNHGHSHHHSSPKTGRVNVHKLKDFVIRVPVTVIIQSSSELNGTGVSTVGDGSGHTSSSTGSGTVQGGDEGFGGAGALDGLVSDRLQQKQASAAANGNGRGTTAIGVIGDRMEVFAVKDSLQQSSVQQNEHTSTASSADRLQQLYQMQQQHESPHTLLSPLDLLARGMPSMGGDGSLVDDELEYELGEEREDDDEEQGVVITRGAIGI
ncbi:hypothetical protein BGW41_001284 [Actinomortierella wolfii]|nr:hypothetical protein BGW41_001284 [Actinomortierella wolfii]